MWPLLFVYVYMVQWNTLLDMCCHPLNRRMYLQIRYMDNKNLLPTWKTKKKTPEFDWILGVNGLNNADRLQYEMDQGN